MTALQIIGSILGLLVSFAALVAALVAAGRYVLNGFHNEHVKPELMNVSNALANNAKATADNTQALAASDATQRASQIDNREAFTRMGDIIADHETRITVNEAELDGLKGVARTGRTTRARKGAK